MKFVSSPTLESDDGSVLTLGIGLIIACLMFVTVVSDISTLWIARSTINRIADGAALAAVQSVDSDAIYRKGVTAGLTLNSASATSRAHKYVAAHGASQTAANVRVTSVRVVGNSVTITIVAEPRLPFGYLLPITVGSMTAKAQARYQLR